MTSAFIRRGRTSIRFMFATLLGKNEPVLFDGKQTNSIAVTRSTRADNCPMVPVPPHGRLIDEELKMRLTKRDAGGNTVMNCDNCEIKLRESCCSKQLCRNTLINKLAAYEDAEEQGLLVHLPCKVGE